MKSLLQIIDNGYMIIMSLILIILGIIMMYLYRRIKLLENSILQHGKVLQSFMINQISNNTKTINIEDSNTINSNNNDDGSIVNNQVKVINNKIDISDDEEYSDDDSEQEQQEQQEEEQEEQEDDDSDSHEEEDSDNDSEIELNFGINSKKLGDLNMEDLNMEDLNMEDIESINIDNLQDEIDSSIMGKDLIKNIKLENDISDNIYSGIDKLEKIKGITKMKIDELRELVVMKNLISNEEVTKYKKQDLIQLLK
tara:strand:+ start:269 stop:1030 length:762 start_codon:yes stop_codon:yes gene_type:complete